MRKQPMGIYLIGCFISVFADRTLEEKYEPRSNSADNLRDFITFLPKKEIKIPNPTFRVFIIGRKMLNYCGNFGKEE